MRIVIFLSILLFCQNIFANLLISPTRVNFDNRERMKEVILINTTTKARVYRIEWGEYLALEEGGYKEFEEPIAEVSALSPYVRMTPRQVRLGPGERQTIKLQLRKKGSMTDSEYRSHLKFIALPPEDETIPEDTSEGMKMKINMLVSYSIPVVYQPKKLHVEASVVEYSIDRRNDGGADLKLTLAKRGEQSAYGRLEIYTKDGQRVGLANNISIFKELDRAKTTVRIPEYAQYANQSEFVLKYIGEKEHSGTVFIDQKLRM
ncbi:fimbrial biogenesis chaperone [Glaciecola sp. 1036]|uniref:fimbrial biogenesis chaperone n=1 Tax=Alteromonadaceae TaxID=72275 RepID=UPI003CFF0FCD